MKKSAAAAACLLLAGALFTFSACDLFGSPTDDNFPSDVAVSSGEYGSAENWLAAQDTPSTYERRLYEEAVADGSFSGTYYEFLASLGLTAEDATAGVQRALCSTVSVEVSFVAGSMRYTSDGSGVIYSLDKQAGDALIVTNFHVVAQTPGGSPVTTKWDTITLTLYGGEEIFSERADGTVRFMAGSNSATDLAVLEVSGSEVLRGSSARAAEYALPEAGETAYAVGNAEGEGMSVTRGVVSRLSEVITITAADGVTPVQVEVMRTDAAINQGNSGGGLFNAHGDLLGIVTARREYTAGGTSVDGFGYAISAERANEVIRGKFGCGEIAPAQEREETPRSLLDRQGALERAKASAVSVLADLGEGSGVIFDLDKETGSAYILTNAHVVYSMLTQGVSGRLDVVLYEDADESEPVAAQFVGWAPEEDIAVLRIENSAVLAASGAREAVAADSSSLTVGEDVSIIGNAGAEGLSVTDGIVSNAGEYFNVASADEKSTVTLFGIRTDAAVNHGNSGGGMYNELGELVGIVSARSEETGVVAFGYAIPANRALLVAQNILDNAPYSDGALRASLGGVTLQTAASRARFDERTGKVYVEEKVVVQSIAGGGAGAKMGLDVNDTLVAASVEREGREVYAVAVTRSYQLTDLLYAVRRGDTLRLTVSRGGEEKELSYTFSSARDFTQE